jgi:hypothetical protein
VDVALKPARMKHRVQPTARTSLSGPFGCYDTSLALRDEAQAGMDALARSIASIPGTTVPSLASLNGVRHREAIAKCSACAERHSFAEARSHGDK